MKILEAELKNFGNFVDEKLTFHDGINVIWAKNGAGKSTTLKMITGILKPTSGSIEFDGHTWRRKDLNDIGTLIETPPLYENLKI